MYFTPKHIRDLVEGKSPDFASGSGGLLLSLVPFQDVVMSNPPYDARTGPAAPDTETFEDAPTSEAQ